jgi:hypothetical protein
MFVHCWWIGGPRSDLFRQRGGRLAKCKCPFNGDYHENGIGKQRRLGLREDRSGNTRYILRIVFKVLRPE